MNFKRTGFFISQIIIFFIFLEVFLRLGGWLYIVYQDFENMSFHSSKNTYNIICLGESITANGGQKSYPRLLEKVLNLRQHNIHFHVFNKGTPSVTTTELLSELDDEIVSLKPNMVVLMLGSNDSFFYQVATKNKFSTFKFYVLDRIKVYRLIKNLIKDIIKKVKNRFNSPALEDQHAPMPEDQEIENITEGGLGFMKYAKGEIWKGQVSVPSYYQDIIHYHPLTIRNFKDMVNMLLNDRIKVVIAQFPLLPIEPLKQKVNAGKEVLFEDNETLFKNAVHQKGRAYFFRDEWGHLTDQGSLLLAEHLADDILKDLR